MKQFTPFEWLMITCASHFGLDNKDYTTRLLWAYEHIDSLEDMTSDAKNKASYTAACLAVRDTQAGEPSGYLVGLDSASSGIQLLSTLSRCVTGMTNTGVLGNDTRPDIYTTLQKGMGSDIPRKPAKGALMTFFYGSEREPKKAFGEGDMLMKFHIEAQNVAPHAYKLRNAMINLWQPYAEHHTWVMPDGHTVHKRVWVSKDTRLQVSGLDNRTCKFRHKVNQGTEKGVSLAADITHSCDALLVREMQARCSYDAMELEMWKVVLEPYRAEITDRTEFVALGSLDTLDMTKATPEYLARMLELVDMVLEHRAFPLVTVHK